MEITSQLEQGSGSESDAPPCCVLSKREMKRQRALEKRNTSKKRQGKRKRLWSETNGHCVYCDKAIPEKEKSLDHIYPQKLGGTWAAENLVAACCDCNSRRGTKMPASKYVAEKWMSYVAKKERRLGILPHNEKSPDAGAKE